MQDNNGTGILKKTRIIIHAPPAIPTARQQIPLLMTPPEEYGLAGPFIREIHAGLVFAELVTVLYEFTYSNDGIMAFYSRQLHLPLKTCLFIDPLETICPRPDYWTQPYKAALRF